MKPEVQCRIHKGSPKSIFSTESTQFLVLIHISLRPILILFSHLGLGLPKGVFPIGEPVFILKALLPSSILDTCPAHLNLQDLITLNILGERYKLWSSSLWSLPQSPFASLVGPNISHGSLGWYQESLRQCGGDTSSCPYPYPTAACPELHID